VDWRSIPVHLLVIAAVLGLVRRAMPSAGIPGVLAVGAVLYLALSRGLRAVLLRDFRAGVAHLRRGEFAKAVPRLLAGYDFLQKHPAVDRYRFLLMLDSSAYSYREMALCNTGFAHARMGQGEEALRWYERAAAEHPDSELSASAVAFARGLRRETASPEPGSE
jgi:tetratricopeptide (TPR) repeat protein